jgi:hypothetical protein
VEDVCSLGASTPKTSAASAFALMMEAVSTSETSVSFIETTWRNIPEHSRLHRGMLFITSHCVGAVIPISVFIHALFGSYIWDNKQNMLLLTKIFL